MRPGWLEIAIVAACFVALVSCGSVANHAGAGGAGGAGGGGGGSGGTAGSTGMGGAPGDGGISARGGLVPIGLAPSANGAVRILRQTLQPSPVCTANVCVSGGLIP